MPNHIVSSIPFHEDGCSGYVQHTMTNDVIIEGRFEGRVNDQTWTYRAAAPADMRASFTGSGLPFTSPEMALQGSPNVGTVTIDSTNSFKITVKMPNSYYAAHGTVLVRPTVYLMQGDRTISIVVEHSIPYRTLTYQNGRTSASFYNIKLPVRSQEKILRDSAYPTSSTLMPINHWGLKPPC